MVGVFIVGPLHHHHQTDCPGRCDAMCDAQCNVVFSINLILRG
jgi:hypothetical protein